MILLNASRHCVSFFVTLLPSSSNGTPCRLLSCVAQLKRTFFTNNCRYQISQRQSKQSHLAVSRPRLYKQLQVEKAKDNLPEDWDLIFSQGKHRIKMNVASWASFIGIFAIPVCLGFGLWQNADEEDVVVANLTISKNTEFSLFVLVNALILATIYRVIHHVPLRVYFKQSQDKYIAVMPHRTPWQTKQVEFTAMDVKAMPNMKTPLMIKPWKHNEFRISNRLMILPQMCFHSGNDRHWLLRFKDMPDNMRKPL